MIILCPAYGRRYRHEGDATKDWESGLDFKILTGPYTSIRDYEKLVDLSKDNIQIWWNWPANPQALMEV